MSEPKGKLKEIEVITTSGIKMCCRVSVEPVAMDAQTIILVHGLSVSSRYMVPTAIRLATEHHVYLPDLPGFGKSPNPSHILNITELADTLASWMEAMKLPPSTFLGNSLGCQVIANLATRHPECINRAILVSPTMDPNALTVHQEVGRLLRDAPAEPLHFIPILTREYIRAGIRRSFRTLQYAFMDPMEAHLAQLHIPTLVVRGSRDPIVPQSWVEKVNTLLPNGELVVIQDAGHAVNCDAPDKLVELVREFLSREQE